MFKIKDANLVLIIYNFQNFIPLLEVFLLMITILHSLSHTPLIITWCKSQLDNVALKTKSKEIFLIDQILSFKIYLDHIL